MCQRAKYIDLSQSQCRLANTLGFGRDRGAQFGEEPALDFGNLLLRIENLGLILFQLWSCKPLCADECLLALVVLRNQMQIRFGHLDVVTKDRVELYFERRDSSSASFSLLNLRQHQLAVAREIAEFIQVFVYAAGNHPAIGKTQWRLRNDCLLDSSEQVTQLVQQTVQSLQTRRSQPSYGLLDGRDLRE